MPSSLSRSRRIKAFNEGRRSAKEPASNPYDNPTLRELWDQGRARELAGELTTPIPPLEHGERRAQRTPHNPPGSKPQPTPRPRPGRGGGGGYSGRGGGYSGRGRR
jgi:hypothetical protein